jgi:hypothetical protein
VSAPPVPPVDPASWTGGRRKRKLLKGPKEFRDDVEQDDRVVAGRDVAADFGEVEVHALSVRIGQDERGDDVARGTDGTEQIGPIVALIARGARPAAALGPDAVSVPCWPSGLRPATRSRLACLGRLELRIKRATVLRLDSTRRPAWLRAL